MNKLMQALKDTVMSCRGYSEWEGKTAAERELIGALGQAVRRSAEALGQDPDLIGTPLERHKPRRPRRTGLLATYERGDTVLTPLGVGTIHDDPDDHGRCRVLLRAKVKERLITATTFQFSHLIRKWNDRKP